MVVTFESAKLEGLERRWPIVVACFICASGYGVFYTLGVFFNTIRHELGWSATLISSIHVVHCICFGAALPIIGKLSTKFGAKPIFLSCSFLLGAGLLLCSRITSIFDFYLFYGIASVGAAVTTSLPLALVQQWFVKRRGFTLGIVSAGLGFGAMAFPTLTGTLLSAFSWRVSYIILGVLTGAMMMTASLFIRDRKDDSAQKPLLMQGEMWSFAQLLKTPTFFVICIVWILASMCTHLIIIHLVPFAENVGMPKAEAAAIFGMIGGISIVSRIFGGSASQKLGWKTTLILCCFSITLLLLWLSCSTSAWMIIFFVVFYGLVFGIRLTTFPGLIGHYFGTRSITAVMSYFWSVAAFAGLVGPLLGGFVFDLTGAYPIAFIFGGCLYALAGCLSMLLNPPKAKQIYRI